ncbi:hypothetical protein D3C85_1558330 [compost metagenome]
MVNQVAGDMYIVRLQRTGTHDSFHLSDNDAAVVANGQDLIKSTEQTAFVFVRKVAALVSGGRTNDRDLWNDGWEK